MCPALRGSTIDGRASWLLWDGSLSIAQMLLRMLFTHVHNKSSGTARPLNNSDEEPEVGNLSHACGAGEGGGA